MLQGRRLRISIFSCHLVQEFVAHEFFSLNFGHPEYRNCDTGSFVLGDDGVAVL